MKKKLCTFFCTLAVLLLGQSAWAAQGDKTIRDVQWSRDGLDYVVGTSGVDKRFVRTEEQGLITLTFTGGDNDMYYTNKYHAGWGSSEARLQLSDCKNSQRKDYVMTWTKPAGQTGYRIKATYAKMLVAQVGSSGDFHLSDTRVTTDNAAGGQSTAETTNIPDSDHVNCYFTRGGGLSVGAFCCMTKFEIQFEITPNAPTWSQDTENAKVTVNHTQDAYLHWIDLGNYIQVANSKFAGTVKYEAVGLDAKYVIWNADQTKCYIIKPGTYQFRAYIDKKDGVYCSSAYTANYLTITATADESEKPYAQIFYMLDDKLAAETDPLNHVWDASVTWDYAGTEHWLEYIYAYDGTMDFEKRTQNGIAYLEKTEDRKDHFKAESFGGSDTVQIYIEGTSSPEVRAWLRINSTKADNHVTFVMDSEAKKDVLVTYTKDVVWMGVRNEMKFAGDKSVSHMSDERVFEVEFYGVPDSLKFDYGNNSDWSSSSASLVIYYAVRDENGTYGAWTELATITGKPNYNDAEAVRFAYSLLPGVGKLKFVYSNVQNSGHLRNLTVTERKGWWMSVPMDSTLYFSGTHQIGGTDQKIAELKWYNLYGTYQQIMTQGNPDRFVATPSGVKQQLGLDKYQEDAKVLFDFKLDSAGVFSTYFMVWNGNAQMTEVPGGKQVYGFLLKGVVKYNADELVITHPQDTIIAEQGDTIPSPFQLTDTTGNVIGTDSVNYSYSVYPANNATVDSLGNITVNCVGVTRIIATLKDNMLIPGGKKDTIYINVPEQTKNKIVWNIPKEIGRGDVLIDLATTADDAKMSYSFNPEFAEQIGTENKIQIGDSIGSMDITATADPTCDHFAVLDTKTITILDIIEDEQVIVKDTNELKDIVPGDSIKDLVVITDEEGDTLLPPAIKITYEFFPENSAHVTTDGRIIIINHAVDPIMVVATTTGEGIKTRKDTIYLHPKHDWEKIEFNKNMPDTMFVGQEYAMGQYITTKSGNGCDSLYVDKALASKIQFKQGPRLATPKDSGVVVIYAIALGNADFWGPDTASHKVVLVRPVQKIDWEDQLQDLSDLKVLDDTVRVDTVHIYDKDGKDITGEITKSYQIIPNPTGNAEVTPDGKIVMTQAGDVMVIITTSGPGYQTQKDTLYMHAEGYHVGRIELNADLDDLRIGDSISLNNVKVYDEDGKDITATKVDTIIYKIEPTGMAKYDEETNSIIVLKEGDFSIIPVVYGAQLDPNPVTDTIQTSAKGYKVGEVVLPFDINNIHVGDTIKLDGARVYDDEGNDITDTQVDKITYKIDPSSSVVYDPETKSYIVVRVDSIKVIAKVEGQNLYPNPVYDTVEVDVQTYKNITIELPKKPGEENYMPGDTIKVDDIKILDEDGNDITDKYLDDLKISFEPKGNAHKDEDGNIVIDKAGDLDITTKLDEQGVEEVDTTTTITVDKFEVGKVEFPADPQGGYHVGDTINTGLIKVYDKDGNEITDQSEITFEFIPSDGAVVDPKTGNIIVARDSTVKILVKVSGDNVGDYTYEKEINVKQYKTGDIIIPDKEPAGDYEPGDKINQDDIKVYDKDGKDITDLADITMEWEPKENAHQDKDGNLVFDKPGRIDVTTCVGGEGLTKKCTDTTYVVRHNEDGCYNLIAQVWDDVLAVNNNEQKHLSFAKPLPQFVSYQWYREEELLPGETSQSYHLSAGEIKDSANYYVWATGVDGKEYLLCGMWVNANDAPQPSYSFQVYPTMITAGSAYTVEVDQAGTVYVSTSNGVSLGSYPVSAGKNVKAGPAANGVYVLQFVPNDGKYEVQKLIVK